MRWILPFILLLAGCSGKPPAPPPPPAFTWTGNGNSTLPACGLAIEVNCLLTFTLTDVTNPSLPEIISSSIPITSYNYVMSTLPTTGFHVYSLVVTGKDAVGNTVTSGSASTSFTIQ